MQERNRIKCTYGIRKVSRVYLINIRKNNDLVNWRGSRITLLIFWKNYESTQRLPHPSLPSRTTPKVPPCICDRYKYRIVILFQSGKEIAIWEDNEAVAELLASKAQPIVHKYKIPVPGGFNAQVRLLIPPDADLSGATKYPMLVYV